MGDLPTSAQPGSGNGEGREAGIGRMARERPQELIFVAMDAGVPMGARIRALELAVRAGYLTEALWLAGRKKAPYELRERAVELAAGTWRNGQLVLLLERRRLPPGLRRKVAEALSANAAFAMRGGWISELSFLAEHPSIPCAVRREAREGLAQCLDEARRRGFFLGVPELAGKGWVPVRLQEMALDIAEPRLGAPDLRRMLEGRRLCPKVAGAVREMLARKGGNGRPENPAAGDGLLAEKSFVASQRRGNGHGGNGHRGNGRKPREWPWGGMRDSKAKGADAAFRAGGTPRMPNQDTMRRRMPLAAGRNGGR